MAAPFIKSVGGKGRLLPELGSRMPARYGKYIEPFCGGAALFFQVVPNRASLGDANPHLVNAYQAVRDAVGPLIEALRVHENNHCAGYYYAQRDRLNSESFKQEHFVAQAAVFVYLNKTSYNGLWRVNSDGEFNVPMGRYSEPNICDRKTLEAAAEALAGVELSCTDYSSLMAAADPGDFVFADSPYHGGFVDYTAAGFNEDDQRVLADSARRCVDRGVQVMLSNADTPFIRDLYAGWRIDTVKCGRSINSDPDGRGAVDEVIITGGYEPATNPERTTRQEKDQRKDLGELVHSKGLKEYKYVDGDGVRRVVKATQTKNVTVRKEKGEPGEKKPRKAKKAAE